MRESKIEQFIGAEVARLGGLYLKMRPTENGYPDRLVLLPGRKLVFLEIKRSGEVATELQLHRMAEIERRGFRCYCVDTVTVARHILKQISNGA